MIVATLVQRYLLSFVAVRIDAATLDFLTGLLALPMAYFTARRTGDIQRRLGASARCASSWCRAASPALTAVVQLLAARRADVRLQPDARARLPRHGAALRLLMRFSSSGCGRSSTSSRRPTAATPRTRSTRSRASRRSRPGRRGRVPRADARQFQSVARPAVPRRLHDHDLRGRASSSSPSCPRAVPVGRRATGDRRPPHDRRARRVQLAGRARQRADPRSCSTLWDSSSSRTVLLDRLDDVFEQEPEQGADRSRAARRCARSRATSSSRNVGFRYGGPEAPPILEDITFDVPAGKTVAIVGRSGSRQDDAGQVPGRAARADRGHDPLRRRRPAARSTTATLRRQIGFVLQENYLFDDTIARNIAFGEDEPDMDRVMWAAQVANAHEFIERLPLGYDTRVGETGTAPLRRPAPADRDRARALSPAADAASSTRRRARSTPSPSAR